MRVGATGHQNLPSESVALIAEALRKQLINESDLVGISSLASGADQLFASIVLSLGGHLEAIIPSEGYENTFDDPNFLEQYHSLLRSATSVHRLPFPEPSEAAFLEAGKEVVNRSDRLIAVWDGKPAQGLGGTADIVAYAKSRELPTTVIWPEGLVRDYRASR
jgi:hypothetical protein